MTSRRILILGLSLALALALGGLSACTVDDITDDDDAYQPPDSWCDPVDADAEYQGGEGFVTVLFEGDCGCSTLTGMMAQDAMGLMFVHQEGSDTISIWVRADGVILAASRGTVAADGQSVSDVELSSDPLEIEGEYGDDPSVGYDLTMVLEDGTVLRTDSSAMECDGD